MPALWPAENYITQIFPAQIRTGRPRPVRADNTRGHRKLCELGYIDDEAFIRSQFKKGSRSGVSQRRILIKLTQKGINRELAEAVIDEQISRAADKEDSELAAALIFARKKSVGPYSHADLCPEDNQRHLARMARNGFAFDVAKQVMALPSADAANDLLDRIYPHQLG